MRALHAWLKLAVFFCFSTIVRGQTLTGQANVQWSGAQKLLLGEESRFHAGELLKTSVNGSVCSPHTDRTETRGWWPFEETVRINHHNQVAYQDLPLTLSLVEERSGQSRFTTVLAPGTTEVTVPGTTDQLSDRLEVAAVVEKIDAARRSGSHGEYPLTVAAEIGGRVALLRQWLAGTMRTPQELMDPNVVCVHMRVQAPREAAAAVLQHARTYYLNVPALAKDAQAVLKFARELDPSNAAVTTALGEAYIASGHYGQAREALTTAITAVKKDLAANPANQENWKTLAVASMKLAEVFYKDKVGIDPDDLSQADVWLGEATAAFEKSGDTVSLRLSLVERARVLQRIRSMEALRAAVDCLDRARLLSPRRIQ